MEMYHAVAKEVLAAREAKVLEVANVEEADVGDLEADTVTKAYTDLA